MGFFRLLIAPPRPSALTDMPAKVTRFLCRKGYTAITLFGQLFTPGGSVGRTTEQEIRCTEKS